MSTELQRLADTLAARLSRSVAIDDAHLRLICHTSHEDEVDELRTVSIMKRSIPGEQYAYVRKHGAFKATGIFSVPPAPQLGMTLPRTGVALRHSGLLLGVLWLLMAMDDLTEADRELVLASAETAALMLHRGMLLDEVTRGRERELMRDLLSAAPELREYAAAEIVEGGLFASGVTCNAFVVLPVLGPEQGIDDVQRTALADCVANVRREYRPGHTLAIVRPDHAVILVVTSPARGKGVLVTGETLRSTYIKLAPAGSEALVGIGASTTLTSALTSYDEARMATTVAKLVPSLGHVVRHSDLGVYGLIAELPPHKVALSIHPGLARALSGTSANDRMLLETLEAYLDLAGDAKRTADLLAIHRGSLYYRLGRIQEVMLVDLSSGEDRLALHLGLKLAKLQQM
jgi:sugar diacid utilization regulator